MRWSWLLCALTLSTKSQSLRTGAECHSHVDLIWYYRFIYSHMKWSISHNNNTMLMFMFLLFIVIEMYVNAASFSVSCKKISFCDCKVVCKGLLVNVLRAWRIRLHVAEVKSLEILSAQHSRVFCPEWPHPSRTKKIQICKERPLLCERPGEKSVMWFWRWKAGWKELASVALKQAWWVLTWFSSQTHCLICLILKDFPYTKCSVYSSLIGHICLYTNKRSTVIIRVRRCLH